MVLSTGSNKIKTAVFISGTGSNLRSLIKFSKKKKSPFVISFVISNNLNAKGLNFANIVSAKNCSKEGCDPPDIKDVKKFIKFQK